MKRGLPKILGLEWDNNDEMEEHRILEVLRPKIRALEINAGTPYYEFPTRVTELFI